MAELNERTFGINHCVWCGKEFVARSPRQTSCGDDHYRPCARCGAPLLVKESYANYMKYGPRTCPTCRKAKISESKLRVSAEEKSQGLAKSAFGIVGLETAFPLMYTYFVKKNIISMERLIELMSLAPRRIMRMGEPQSFVKMNLDKHYIIDPAQFISLGKATPFAGWEVYGQPVWD